MNYKKICIPAVLASFVFVSVTAPAFAANEKKVNVMRATTTIKVQNRFCEQLPALRTKVLEKTDKQSSVYEKQMFDRTNKFETRFTNRDTVRTEKRANADENVTKNLGTLRAKYPDAQDQAAITTFEASVKQALEIRRKAVDTAVLAYQNEISSTTAHASSTKQNGVVVYKQAVIAALDRAQAACASSTDPLVVKEAFKNDLAKAGDVVKDARKTIVDMKGTIDTFTEARRTAIENAEKIFKSTVDAARVTLKAVLAQ